MGGRDELDAREADERFRDAFEKLQKLIIGRLSGDEFAIVLAEAHEHDGLEGRVRARVAQAAEHTDYPLSVSIGVARCGPVEYCSLVELVERADQAMYAEKAAKRGPPSE
jgi:diguanylate cyclase (GGDEF)-like protein